MATKTKSTKSKSTKAKTPRGKTAKSKASTSSPKSKSGAQSGRCWAGFEPVPGKKAFTKGSCKKK